MSPVSRRHRKQHPPHFRLVKVLLVPRRSKQAYFLVQAVVVVICSCSHCCRLFAGFFKWKSMLVVKRDTDASLFGIHQRLYLRKLEKLRYQRFECFWPSTFNKTRSKWLQENHLGAVNQFQLSQPTVRLFTTNVDCHFRMLASK